MKKEEFIAEIEKRLKRYDRLHDIRKYLTNKGLSEEDANLYLETARQRIYNQKVKQLPKKRILQFSISVAIVVLTLALFIFFLPGKGIRFSTIFSILGSISFVIASYFSFVYYKSWEEEKVKQSMEKKGNHYDVMLAISAIPLIIMYFIFSWILSAGADKILKNTQEEAIGTIVTGSSYTSRGFDISDVTVEFKTKEGKKIRAREDVSEYEFKQFYKGQKVRIIYSTENPENIQLLVNRSDIKKFKDTEERDIEPKDLISLLNTPANNILESLNKISFGWEFDKKNNCWKNPIKTMIFYKHENEISLITNQMAMMTFPKYFKAMGFLETTEKPIKNPLIQKYRTFENDKYVVSIQKGNAKNSVYNITTLRKRQ